ANKPLEYAVWEDGREENGGYLGPRAVPARARGEGRPSPTQHDRSQQFYSREGEIHVPTEDRVAGDRGGGHHGATSQRLHPDGQRNRVAHARRVERRGESPADGTQRGAIQPLRPMADRR